MYRKKEGLRRGSGDHKITRVLRKVYRVLGKKKTEEFGISQPRIGREQEVCSNSRDYESAGALEFS
jgi:hypothetical protein